MDLQKLYNNLKAVDAIKIAEEVLIELEPFMADLNRSQLTEQGIKPDGSKLQEYTEFTKFLKSKYGQGIGKITSHTTLFDKGDLNKSIFADVKYPNIKFDATDPKKDGLLEKYGEWRGLTENNTKILIAKFLPIYYKKLDDAIYR